MMRAKKIVDISVIIPTYNRRDVLRDTVNSLLKEETQPLEIIVIDQTADDVPFEIFRKSLSALAENLQFITQKEANANVARNRGIRESRGSILLFLDDDVVFAPGFLERHFLNYGDLSIAAVSGQVLEEGQAPTDIIPKEYYRRHTGWLYFPLNFSRRSEVINLTSCNLSIRREVIVEAGGFDENYIKTFFDDSDLSLRVHRLCLVKKLKTIHDPAAGLLHLKARGGDRPSGINQYVIADRTTWMIWLYFLVNNFGLLAWPEIANRFRRTVLRKVNLLHPKYLVMAFLEFILGCCKALKVIKQGRKLGFNNNQDYAGN
jgi:glycosyltransferase involved in cell wall biosynthesis